MENVSSDNLLNWGDYNFTQERIYVQSLCRLKRVRVIEEIGRRGEFGFMFGFVNSFRNTRCSITTFISFLASPLSYDAYDQLKEAIICRFECL